MYFLRRNFKVISYKKKFSSTKKFISEWVVREPSHYPFTNEGNSWGSARALALPQLFPSNLLPVDGNPRDLILRMDTEVFCLYLKAFGLIRSVFAFE